MAENKRIAPFFNADGTVKEFTAQDSTARNTGDYAVQNKNLATVGARYSIKNVDGKDIVSVDTDQDIFEGVDRSEYGKVARDYIKEHFRGKNVDGISFTKQSEKEYTMSQDAKRLYNNGTLYDTKMKSSTELDNFVKTGTLIAHEETKHPHTYNEGGYNRYAVEFELGGKKFTGEMLVALNEKSEGMFYDIVKIKEKSVSRYPSASKTSLEGGRNTSSTNNIRYKTEKVNSFEEKSFEKASQTVGKVNENAYSSSLKGRESEFLYAPVSAETMPTETAKKVMNTLTKLTKGDVNIVLTEDAITTESGAKANGLFKDGIIYLDAKADNYEQIKIVGAHEVIHSLEGTKAYNALANYVAETISKDPALQRKYGYEKYRAVYDSILEGDWTETTKDYQAMTEIFADYIANEVLVNEESLRRVTNRDANILVKLYQWVRDSIKRLGNTESELASKRSLRKMERLLSTALNESSGGVSLETIEKNAREAERTKEKAVAKNATLALARAKINIDNKGKTSYNKKRSYYSQFNTLATSWASRAEKGELFAGYDGNSYRIVIATGDDYLYENYKTVDANNDALIEYYEEFIKENNERIQRESQEIRKLAESITLDEGFYDNYSAITTRESSNGSNGRVFERQSQRNGNRNYQEGSKLKQNGRASLDVALDQKTTGRVQTVVNDRKRSVKEVWDETLDNLKTGSADRWIRAQISLTDEQAGIVQAGKNVDVVLHGEIQRARSAKSAALNMLNNEQRDFSGEKKVGESLKAIFEPIQKKGEKYAADFNLYLYHLLNVDRMSLEEKGIENKPVFEEEVTAEFSKEKVAELEKRRQKNAQNMAGDDALAKPKSLRQNKKELCFNPTEHYTKVNIKKALTNVKAFFAYFLKGIVFA